MHNGVPSETLLHCERFAAAGVLTGEWAPFLVKRENVALEIKDRRVGPTTAFPGTPAHLPLQGVSLHMLLQVILAFKGFLADFTSYGLFMGFPHVFQKLCPRFRHEGTFFFADVALVDLPVSLQPAAGGEVFPTSLMGTPGRTTHEA